MLELVIASRSQGKIREIRHLLQDASLLSLDDIGFDEEVEEPFQTFEENALVKAQAVHKFSGRNVFADDSGICVAALNGAPGVNSAFFGGLPRSNERNNETLLNALAFEENRAAFYKSVICLIWNEQPFFFEGICEGRIGEALVGNGGFGYDPLFIPNGYDITFAELPLDLKNMLSHRGKALKKLVEFLNGHGYAL